MFEKLLSVLPYNPGLAGQMAFYSRRMHEEANIRRTGLLFIVLTFFIQFFAVLVPPVPTAADPPNDLLDYGISSPAEAKKRCKQNEKNFRKIVRFYGISCNRIGNAEVVTLDPNSHGGQLYSMGRKAYNKPGETPVSNIPGVKTKYWRLLNSWGPNPYQALKLKNASGKTFWILFDCGNLVSVGFPQPEPQTATWEPGDNEIQTAIWEGDTPVQPIVSCPYNNALPQNSPLCVPPTQTTMCPYNPSLPANSPQCFQPCPNNPSLPIGSPQCNPPPQMCPYNQSLPADSPACFQQCPYNPNLPVGDADCKPCDKSVSSEDTTACIEVHKTAANVTQGNTDANGTTAKPGDVITYTISARNNGKKDVKNYLFFEDVSDVLDYADIVDLFGGTINDDDEITWPKETIKAGETITHKITVKIKDPIPATPTATSSPETFDLKMINIYGDTVVINVPGPPSKQVEVAAAALPNTGPGETLAVAAAIVIIAGYFFGRARLLSEESAIAVQESSGV